MLHYTNPLKVQLRLYVSVCVIRALWQAETHKATPTMVRWDKCLICVTAALWWSEKEVEEEPETSKPRRTYKTHWFIAATLICKTTDLYVSPHVYIQYIYTCMLLVCRSSSGHGGEGVMALYQSEQAALETVGASYKWNLRRKSKSKRDAR